ncbi:MAG: DNA-processing protein DprA [Acidobacteriia bacterium]|nr:DNA-protecting protein DprA [Methyloceanibacter sp.]MCL6491969.1 DNA-processing protein DprA [Terriglobia bacterium]
MTPKERLSRIRLARTEGVGPMTYRRLLYRYSSAEEALIALPELARAGGRSAPPRVPSMAEIAREEEALQKMGGKFLLMGEAPYPPLLALLDDAPPVVAVLGTAETLSKRAVALIGARNASANGQRIAEHLGEELAEAGFVVVSGMARGIDAAAHRGAMRAHNGRGCTVAVVAGGLDVPYPHEHVALQQAIAEHGAVVSEMPLGTAPQARHFPRRNRIIAGLVLGVVVVEAALRSGSLVTVRIAQNAGREIFAVPGSPLDPRARGTNDLIRQGAHLTESISDVLENLPDHPAREGLSRLPLFAREAAFGSDEILEDSPEDRDHADRDAGGDVSAATLAELRTQIPDLLDRAPIAVDELVRRCHFPAAAVMAVLLELELAGRIETLPGNRVALLGTSP